MPSRRQCFPSEDGCGMCWQLVGISLMLLAIYCVLTDSGDVLVASITTLTAFSRAPVASSSASGFNIELEFDTEVESGVRELFESARLRWEAIITADIGETVMIETGQQVCNRETDAPRYIDDLLIFVSILDIDGSGGVLAMSGPCASDAAGHVRAGVLTFDLSDLHRLMESNTASSVVLHEMGHVLGLGTLWEGRGLISPPGTDPIVYLGKSGNLGNADVGATGKALIEDEGGDGTARSHWKESIYRNELMTGYVSEYSQVVLSALTIRALEDLGYTVNVSQAEPFDVRTALSQRKSSSFVSPARLRKPVTRNSEDDDDEDNKINQGDARATYGNDVLDMPIVIIHPTPSPAAV